MKKTLVVTLALVFVLGIAGTAFAATNPFVDVPAKHWAYDAVSKLAHDGIIDGYGDGTFRGDKTLTRYEMAQIVAKAMAKSDKASAEDKALVDKLAVEFNAELQNLGVRVAKLEANQSKIKFTGDARVRYDNLDKSGSVWKNRFRVNMTGDINDNTSMFARYVYADNNFGGVSYTYDNTNQKDGTNRLSDMAFTTKGLINNTAITVGRYTLNLGPTTNFSGTTGNMDGIMTNSTFGKAGLMMGYANASYWASSNDMKDVYFAEATYAFDNKVKMNLDYFKNKTTKGYEENYDIFGGGVVYKFSPNWQLIGEYYQNSADNAKMSDGDKPTATIAKLAYKGVNPSKPGSYGMAVEYTKYEGYSLPYGLSGSAIKVNGADVGLTTNNGLKSWDFQVAYALAKNVTFEGFYQFNIKDAVTGNDAPNDKFTRVQINYFF